jgi:ubiquitin-like-conjugating enzyme ATG3
MDSGEHAARCRGAVAVSAVQSPDLSLCGLAGDLLVFKCPSWSWEAGDPAKVTNPPAWPARSCAALGAGAERRGRAGGRQAKEYLPRNKQYLVTKNVPCHSRVAALHSSVREMQVEDTEDSEWTDTQSVSVARAAGRGGNAGPEVEDIDDEDEDMEVAAGAAAGAPAAVAGAPAAAAGGADEELPDLDDLELEEEGGLLPDDPSALPAASEPAAAASDFVKTRSYNISITYDKYYMVPRMWLFGYGEDSRPLSHKQVFEDISSDHANRTVTVDPHPHIAGVSHASVHPCRHGPAMKRIIDQMEDNEAGRQMRPDMSLFLFLKFISSIIPTIEYDWTENFES